MLETFERSEIGVSKLVLNSVDTHYMPKDIRYVLMKEYSTEGEFHLLRLENEDVNEWDGWELRPDGIYQKKVTEWSQQNIDDQEVSFNC